MNRMHGRTLVSLVALGLAALTALPAQAASKKKTWVATALPTLPAWSGSFGNDVSDSGYVGGGWIDATGAQHGAFWYGGVPFDVEDAIGVPAGCEGGGANIMSVNGAGLMGGASWSPDQMYWVATLWDAVHGTAKALQTQDASQYFSAAWAVNASGDAAGYLAHYIDVWPWYAQQPIVWPKGTTGGTVLPTGDFAEGWVSGMSSSGVMAGTVITRGEAIHAAVWRKDAHGDYELVDLAGQMPAGYVWSQAFDVGEDGTVCGHAFTEDFSTQSAWTWTEKGGVVLLDTNGSYGIAFKIVSKYVAGMADGFGAVWTQGALEQIPMISGWSYMEGSSVDKGGFAVGYGLIAADPSGTPQGWYAEKK